VRKEKERVE